MNTHTYTYNVNDAEELIRELLTEAGGWGDGTPVQDGDPRAAAERPWEYDIHEADLVGAIAGEVAALIRIREAFGLPPFC